MGLRSRIEKLSIEAGLPFDMASSSKSGDYRFLEPFIKEKSVTDVVVIGGDGTVSQVVGSLKHLPLNFGIIPCGSGNGLAFAAGIPRDPDKAFSILRDGSALDTDAFSVNGKFGCMLCGLGFDALVAHDFANQSKRGLYTYVRQVMKNFFQARSWHFDILVGDKAIHTDAFFTSIANSNQFGNHFTIAPKASLDDGLLDVVIVTGQNKLNLLWQTLRQVRGVNRLEQVALIEHRKGVIYFQTNELRVLNHDKAPMHIDGDPTDTANELNVSVIRHCFKLYRPNLNSK